MSIARRLKWYLESLELDYELLRHRETSTTLEAADAARVPGERVAKCVLLADERGYLMAILPAAHRIDLATIKAQLGRRLELADEREIEEIFFDCVPGAVPPVAGAYGIPAVVDDILLAHRDIYFEAGDHQDLIHVSGEDFRGLVAEARRAHFSWHI